MGVRLLATAPPQTLDAAPAYVYASPMLTYAHIARPLEAFEPTLPSAESESVAPAVKRLSDRHRRLARMIAEGVSEQDAGFACGYTPARISILKADRTFIQLIEFYRRQVEENFSSTTEKLAELTNLAAEEVITRLEDKAEEFDLADLLEIVKMGADRTGHAPAGKNSQPQITFNIGARLDAAAARARTIEGKVINEQD